MRTEDGAPLANGLKAALAEVLVGLLVVNALAELERQYGTLYFIIFFSNIIGGMRPTGNKYY